MLGDLWENLANVFGHRQQVGIRRNANTDEDGLLTVEGNVEVIIFGAEYDVSNVLQTHNRIAFLFNNQIFEFVDRMQVGFSRHIHFHHLAFGRTNG